MYLTSFLSAGCFVISTLAQSINLASVVATTGNSLSTCDGTITACATTASSNPTTTTISSSITTSVPYLLTNLTTMPANFSATMLAKPVSNNTTANYINITAAAPETSTSVPTSIVIATGSPIIPGSGQTITSFMIVASDRTAAAAPASPAPTKSEAGFSMRRGSSVSGIAVALLGLSLLLA